MLAQMTSCVINISCQLFLLDKVVERSLEFVSYWLRYFS